MFKMIEMTSLASYIQRKLDYFFLHDLNYRQHPHDMTLTSPTRMDIEHSEELVAVSVHMYVVLQIAVGHIRQNLFKLAECPGKRAFDWHS